MGNASFIDYLITFMYGVSVMASTTFGLKLYELYKNKTLLTVILLLGIVPCLNIPVVFLCALFYVINLEERKLKSLNEVDSPLKSPVKAKEKDKANEQV